MIQYILDVTLCWAILYLIFYAFLRKVTFFSTNRYYLLNSLTIGLLLPILRNLDFTFNRPEVLDVVPLAVMIQQSPIYISQQISTNPLSEYYSYALICIYILGVAFFLARLVKGLNDIRWIYITGEKEQKENYTLVYSDQEHLPFSFGKAVFISKKVPLTQEIDKIITHELNHVHSRHTLDVLYVELLNILFWFNPLIYLYKSAIKQTHEYLADAAVLRKTDKKMYGRILLRQSLSGIQIALAHSFFQSHIKNRINMMYQKKSGRIAWLKYALVLPFIAVLAMAFSKSNKSASTEPSPTLSSNLPLLLLKEGRRITFKKDLNLLKSLSDNYNGVEMANNPKHISEFINTHNVQLTSEDKHKQFAYAMNYFKSNYFYESKNNRNSYKIELTSQGNIKAYYTSKNNTKPLLVIDQGNASKQKIRFVKKGNEYEAEVMNKDLPIDGFIIKIQHEDNLPLSPTPSLRKDGLKLISDKRSAQEWKGHLIQPYHKSTSPTNITFIDTAVHKVVDHMPIFPGCLDLTDSKEKISCSNKNLMMYLYSNLKYPTVARKNNIEGTVYAQFIVEPDGMLSDIKVLRGIGGGCGKAVLDVIESMNNMEERWTPGVLNHQFVRVQYTLPVRFKMEEEKAAAESNDKVTTKNKEENLGGQIHKVVDQMPRFPGCENLTNSEKMNSCSEENLLMYIFSNLKYPAEARKNNIQGKVYAKFIVEPDGMLSEIKVVRDIGGGCGQAVLDVIESMNIMEEKWTPGILNDKKVRVQYTLPVSFKMEEEKALVESEDHSDAQIHNVVEEMPRFPGCEEGDSGQITLCANEQLLKYVYDNIVYPESAKKKQISGQVYIQFIVDKDGSIDDAKIVRNIGGGCGEAALKMVQSMNEMPQKWRPGYQKGKPVRVKYTLPVTFELTESLDTLVIYDPVTDNEKVYKLDKDGSASQFITPTSQFEIKKYANFDDVFDNSDFKKARLEPSKVLIRVGGNQYYHSDTAKRFVSKNLTRVTVYNKDKGEKEFGGIGKNGIIDIHLGGNYLGVNENFDAHQSEGNSIEISYLTHSDLPVELYVTDINGRKIDVRTINVINPGQKASITIRNLNLQSGIYSVTIQQGSDLRSKKISYISK